MKEMTFHNDGSPSIKMMPSSSDSMQINNELESEYSRPLQESTSNSGGSQDLRSDMLREENVPANNENQVRFAHKKPVTLMNEQDHDTVNTIKITNSPNKSQISEKTEGRKKSSNYTSKTSILKCSQS